MRALQSQLRPSSRRGSGVALRKFVRTPSNPITKGYVCNKGFTIPLYIEHAQRLTHPLRRLADGSFEKATWEQAITANRFDSCERLWTDMGQASSRVGRNRRTGQPHGRRLGDCLSARHGVSTLVQRLCTGENTAPSSGCTDVRCFPRRIFSRRHLEDKLPACHGNESQGESSRPPRHRHLQGTRKAR